ncbi:hypothetical protein [Bacillus mycoides]
MAYSRIPCEGQAGKKIQNTAKVKGDTVPPQDQQPKFQFNHLGKLRLKK